MMIWSDGDWSWGGWVAMMLGMLVFWALVAWVVVSPIRRPSDTQRSAQELLEGRFARGEIDEEEFNSRRNALRSER